jgi:hypothetical protein
MKKLILLFGLVLFIHFSLNAQKISNISNSNAKNVFFEIGGPGLASLNYDMRFNKTGEGLGFRAGIGGFPGVLTLPLGLNYIASKDNKHFFEFGAGYTVLSVKEQGSDMFSNSFGHTTIGYRLQPKDGGFTFRATLNPLFVGDGFFPFYAGIGFGWKF